MEYCLIFSKLDKASMNVYNQIKDRIDAEKTIVTEKETINLENADKIVKADFYIFVSRHASKNPQKFLSVHAPGNWGKAELGGQPDKICSTSSTIMKQAMIILDKYVEEYNAPYYVAQEATHHGPYLDKPCMFIEIGSNEEEWNDQQAGEIIAKTLDELIKFKPDPSKYKHVIVIGGPHTSQRIADVMVKSKYAISHICPKYALKSLTPEKIKQTMEKDDAKIDAVILDDTGDDKEKTMLQELDIEPIKLKTIIKEISD